MTYRVFTISDELGPVTYVDQPKAPDLKQMQAIVKGLIETVPYFTKLTVEGVTYTRGTAYCNEEGLIHGMKRNHEATKAWIISAGAHDSALHGPVVFYCKLPTLRA